MLCSGSLSLCWNCSWQWHGELLLDTSRWCFTVHRYCRYYFLLIVYQFFNCLACSFSSFSFVAADKTPDSHYLQVQHFNFIVFFFFHSLYVPKWSYPLLSLTLPTVCIIQVSLKNASYEALSFWAIGEKGCSMHPRIQMQGWITPSYFCIAWLAYRDMFQSIISFLIGQMKKFSGIQTYNFRH